MKDENKTQAQLIEELGELRRQVAQQRATGDESRRSQRQEIRRVVQHWLRGAVDTMQSSDDIFHVLSVLKEGLHELEIPFQDCGVNLINPHQDPAEVGLYSLGREGEWKKPDQGFGQDLVFQVWKTGVPAYRRDLQAEDIYDESKEYPEFFGHPVRCVLDVPFGYGTLAVNSEKPDAFSPEDMADLENLALVLEEGFRRQEDFRNLEQRNRNLEAEITERKQVEALLKENDRLLNANHQIGRTILSTLNRDEILKTLAEQIVTAGILRSLAISLVDNENRYVEQVLSLCVSATGFSWDIEGDFPSYPLDDKDIVAETARTGEMQVAVGWDDRFTLRPEMNREGFNEGHAVFFIPVKQQDRVVAVLATGSLIEEKEEVLHRIELMEPLLDQVAIALAHARLYEQAQQEITERQQAEEEVRSSQARLQHLTTTTPAVIYSCQIEDQRFIPTFASTNIKEHLGYTVQECVGNADWWASRLHPEDRDRVLSDLSALYEWGSHIHEYRFRCSDGTYRWVHDQMNLVRNEEGNPVEIVGSWLDVTERRQAEEKRKQLGQVLIQSERMAAIGITAAGIVHNLKGHLLKILMNTEILQMDHPDLTHLEEIISSAGDINKMIEDILAKSRRKKATESVDLNALIARELDFLEANPVFKHEVEKDTRLAKGLPVVGCVYSDFSQVFGNLLRNAVDAMHQRDTKKLSVVTSLTGKHIIVEITDTGCGIPEANIPHLFAPFFTTKSSAVEGDEPSGTGLGLYTVQQLLEPYGADIEVESVVDMGTTFRVKILI